MGTFHLSYPNPHNMSGDRKEEDVVVSPGSTLRQYLRERRLIGLHLGCRTILLPQKLPLRLYYVPKEGDVIRLLRV